MHAPIRIVLVRPRNPKNIGAAARAMKNFGFTDLVVVAPHPPVWYEALVSAVGGEDVIRGARVENTLLDAVSDCSLVIGTAGGRRVANIGPTEAREVLRASEKGAALVFGSEKTGLTNAEMSICHKILTIPTEDECPSLNLAQAVAICCYELGRTDITGTTGPESDDATIGQIEMLLGKSIELLRLAGFFESQNERRLIDEFRRSFLRIRPSAREVTLWLGAVNQIAWKLRHVVPPSGGSAESKDSA
jgi:tRNA/rRNA methyltransferase